MGSRDDGKDGRAQVRDGLGDVRIPTPVPKGEGSGAPSSWYSELAGTLDTRLPLYYATFPVIPNRPEGSNHVERVLSAETRA